MAKQELADGTMRSGGTPAAAQSRQLVEADPTAAVVAAATELAVVPEVEELGRVLDRRRFRPGGFSVTDLTAAEWCQQQLALALTARVRKVSACLLGDSPRPCMHEVLQAGSNACRRRRRPWRAARRCTARWRRR